MWRLFTYVYTMAPGFRLPSIQMLIYVLGGTVMVPSEKPQAAQDCLQNKISARSGHLGLTESWLGSLMFCGIGFFKGERNDADPMMGRYGLATHHFPFSRWT